jgi:hypothetical protein
MPPLSAALSWGMILDNAYSQADALTIFQDAGVRIGVGRVLIQVRVTESPTDAVECWHLSNDDEEPESQC